MGARGGSSSAVPHPPLRHVDECRADSGHGGRPPHAKADGRPWSAPPSCKSAAPTPPAICGRPAAPSPAALGHVSGGQGRCRRKRVGYGHPAAGRHGCGRGAAGALGNVLPLAAARGGGGDRGGVSHRPRPVRAAPDWPHSRRPPPQPRRHPPAPGGGGSAGCCSSSAVLRADGRVGGATRRAPRGAARRTGGAPPVRVPVAVPT